MSCGSERRSIEVVVGGVGVEADLVSKVVKGSSPTPLCSFTLLKVEPDSSISP